MRTEVYRHTRDAWLFIVVPKGVPPPIRVRVAADREVEAHEWQLSRELEVDASKLYVGLDVEAAIADLARQQWHLGTSTDSSHRR
jgi:hypothetical protein